MKELFHFEGLTLDVAERTLERDGIALPLTPKVFDTLVFLVKNPGRILTKDQLMKELWPDSFVEEVNLAVNISTLRKVLGEDPQERRFIQTVPGRGYRFVASVQSGVDESSTSAPDSPTALHATSNRETNVPTARLKLRYFPAVLLALAVAAAGSYIFLAHQGKKHAPPVTANSIAVLPFIDLSQNKDQEYFSDGLSEELINELGKVPGLRVVPRSSAFQFRGRTEDIRVIGQKLGVAHILEGSVHREGNHLRVTAELTKVEDGFQLWSEAYDRQMDDIFAVQDEISRAVTQALQLKLLAKDSAPESGPAKITNAEAYEAYLQSRYFFRRGEAQPDLGKALAYNDRAVQRDPAYAPAWALRSLILTTMSSLGMREHHSGYAEARRAADRSIQLDPQLSAAYLSLALEQISNEWDWGGAEASLRKAMELEPGNLTALSYRAYLYECRGQVDEAIAMTEQAATVDPERAQLYLGDLLYKAGRYDEAKSALEKVLSSNPKLEGAHANLSRILLAQGHPEQAFQEIEKEPGEWERLTGEALAYHDLGRSKDSDAALRQLITRHSSDSPYQVAEVYAHRGETDQAFEWLERSYRDRDPGLNQLKSDPLLNSLRKDPRFRSLLQKMNLV